MPPKNEPSPSGTCECVSPNEDVTWQDRGFIGATADYWEISRLRCAKCGTQWASAFLEYEAFSRSGRHYRAPVTDTSLEEITPEAALRLIEAAPLRIAGGSRFDGIECVDRGPGELFASP
ncbi:hypothetical protein Q3O98_03880 [Ralstonia pseudosolanacearum]|uniref:hypothetical protein n=1 Tax=Ralstonia pseudosolanacearum TaxID=1310165 RepID=UPI000AC839CD|nr:hypothetical protein [Ralstonia pseudosolanacearum]MDO3558285.1 hypothetical protein [Ralstonia pseudosolanacearum]MDO3575522.1 hypothetical protein [Ralstonia pseudosolanacearum]MDO3586894.1 hypothetical protein [Ralstonia pseudosolanacearum]MDO3620232.1 hypothetical protein [Ralstonia pseudosolanacearum]